MKRPRLFIFAIFCFAFSAAIFAQESKMQTAPESKKQLELRAKALALASETADEAASLRLAENRTLVYGAAAKFLWEENEKRARALAQSATDELIAIQNSPELPKTFDPENTNYRFYVFNNLRGRLLYQIRHKDPALALKILYATRPPALADAVQRYRQTIAETGKAPDLTKLKQTEREKMQYANYEIQQEQEIKNETVKNDPQRLAENIRESFAKEINIYQILPDLDRLNEKDHDLAQKILGEFIERSVAADFSEHSKWYFAFQLYARYLTAQKAPQQSAKSKKNLEIPEKGLKAIANREFDYLLNKDLDENYFNFVERVLYLKRILPERFDEIKPKYERAKSKDGAGDWADDFEAVNELGESPAFAQIIENSPRLSARSRAEYYKKAASKLLESEGEAKTRQTLGQIRDARDKENALDHLNALLAEKKAGAETIAEAKQTLAQIKSDKEKIAKLINLAISFHKKKTADSQKIADELMSEAVKYANENPATATELEILLPVISAYATINPPRAFDLVAPIVAGSNDLLDAYVLLANYNDAGYPYVRENEIVFGAQDGYDSFRGKYGETVKKLASEDFDRTRDLIKIFRRGDARTMANLILLESILEPQK